MSSYPALTTSRSIDQLYVLWRCQHNNFLEILLCTFPLVVEVVFLFAFPIFPAWGYCRCTPRQDLFSDADSDSSNLQSGNRRPFIPSPVVALISRLLLHFSLAVRVEISRKNFSVKLVFAVQAWRSVHIDRRRDRQSRSGHRFCSFWCRKCAAIADFRLELYFGACLSDWLKRVLIKVLSRRLTASETWDWRASGNSQ